jgi:hypothetical protein
MRAVLTALLMVAAVEASASYARERIPAKLEARKLVVRDVGFGRIGGGWCGVVARATKKRSDTRGPDLFSWRCRAAMGPRQVAWGSR